MVKSVRRLTRKRRQFHWRYRRRDGPGPLARECSGVRGGKNQRDRHFHQARRFRDDVDSGVGKVRRLQPLPFHRRRRRHLCVHGDDRQEPARGPGSCSGDSSDKTAEWPAITTTGAPVAGPGVSQKLLGSVVRPGIGDQVTYAGHPLYLFDQGPGQITGEGWDEPSLPPWHGLWWLVSPSGTPLAWPETLTTASIAGKTVLVATMLTGIGWKEFPVYSFTRDTATTSNCTGPCAIGWPPLLTNGKPAAEGKLSGGQPGHGHALERDGSGHLQGQASVPVRLRGHRSPGHGVCSHRQR